MENKKSSCASNTGRTLGDMKQLLCKLMGHQEYEPEVLEAKPWLDDDFYGYDELDFREPKCLRCGEPLERQAA